MIEDNLTRHYYEFYGEPYPERKYLTENGWVYREIQWIPRELWKEILEVINQDNYKLLNFSQKTDFVHHSELSCGNLIISPDGLENFNNHYRLESVREEIFKR